MKLTVSLPRLNAGYTQAIQAILAEGQLGELTEVRTRLSHGGALPTPESPRAGCPSISTTWSSAPAGR